MTRPKVSESINILMAQSTKVNGILINSMEKERSLGTMALPMRENMSRGKRTAKGSSSGGTARRIKETL